MLVIENFILAVPSEANTWYQNIEKRLAFEQYEERNKQFDLSQNKSSWHMIESEYGRNLMKIINNNMQKCQKVDEVELALEKIR